MEVTTNGGDTVCALTSSAGSGVNIGCLGNGAGDPEFVGFDGRVFDFVGEGEKYYNLISEKDHQINAKLFDAVMWDHNGTYISDMGFKYKTHRIRVSVASGDTEGKLSVEYHERPLGMRKDQASMVYNVTDYQNLAPGELSLVWELYHPEKGNYVEIFTPLIDYQIWSVPAGQPDVGGVPQPAYLNFQTKLKSPPQDEMHGIVGQTYHGFLLDDADSLPNDHSYQGEGEFPDFQVSELFADDFKYNRFGVAYESDVAQSTGAHKTHKARELIALGLAETDFPLAARWRQKSRKH
jgi:hypothetical protein